MMLSSEKAHAYAATTPEGCKEPGENGCPENHHLLQKDHEVKKEELCCPCPPGSYSPGGNSSSCHPLQATTPNPEVTQIDLNATFTPVNVTSPLSPATSPPNPMTEQPFVKESQSSTMVTQNIEPTTYPLQNLTSTNHTEEGTGLSPGVIAGIVVAVAVFIIIIIIIIVLVRVYRKRKQKRPEQKNSQHQQNNGSGPTNNARTQQHNNNNNDNEQDRAQEAEVLLQNEPDANGLLDARHVPAGSPSVKEPEPENPDRNVESNGRQSFAAPQAESEDEPVVNVLQDVAVDVPPGGDLAPPVPENSVEIAMPDEQEPLLETSQLEKQQDDNCIRISPNGSVQYHAKIKQTD